jgi:hypothetical protein
VRLIPTHRAYPPQSSARSPKHLIDRAKLWKVPLTHEEEVSKAGLGWSPSQY